MLIALGPATQRACPSSVPAVPGEGCQAGTLLAESIMRQQDELSMRQRAEEEARQWGRAETAAAREQEEEEEESDSEDGSDQGRQQGPAQVGIGSTQQRQDERQQQQGTAGSQQVHEQPAGVGGGGRPHAGPDGAGSDAAGEEEGPSYVRISPEEQRENGARGASGRGVLGRILPRCGCPLTKHRTRVAARFRCQPPANQCQAFAIPQPLPSWT